MSQAGAFNTGGGVAPLNIQAFAQVYNQSLQNVFPGNTFTFDSNGPLVNITHVLGSDTVTVTVAGYYLIRWMVNGGGSGGPFTLLKNGVAVPIASFVTSAGAFEPIGEGIISVAAGDTFQLRYDGIAFPLTTDFALGYTNVSMTFEKLTPTPAGGGGGAVDFLVGNNGLQVGPDVLNEIFLLTDNTTVQFDGNPGINTITQDFGLSNLILGSNVSGLTVGLQNVGLGLTALDNITAGSSNVGIGAGALFNNTTGSNNIAVGSSALLSNVIANQNVAIGTSALQNSNAFGNIAIGHQALFSNTTGIDNIAIGPIALTANVSGNDNIAIGLGTLINNVSGISNIGIGSGVLIANTNDENIGIGQGSLSALTTGFNNIAIGINAGNAYTTNESNNITIGLVGVIGESNVTRIANIYGDTVGGTNALVFIDNTGHLGTVGGGASALITLTGNTGGAVPPTAGNITIVTQNASVEFVGAPGFSTITQDFGLVNLVLGSSLPALAGGVNNAGFGDNAFTAITTGSQNTAIGNDSVTSLTTGSDNVAVGFNALDSLISGDRNIAIGSTAGSTYAGAESDNIVIGATGILGDSGVIRLGVSPTITETFVAGIYGSTVGVTNAPVFIDNTGKLGTLGGGTGDVLTLTGNDAVAVNPDGAGNIDVITANSTVKFLNTPAASNNLELDFGLANLVLGDSLPALTIGTNNVGLGNTVLNALTAGNQNTIIGNDAGIAITTGFANTVVGYGALDALTTGDSNVAIGLGTGSAYTGAEADNILIGTSVPGILGESAAIRIGNSNTTGIQITGGTRFIHNYGATNTFVGQDAGNFTLSNVSNTGIGSRSLQALTTGQLNSGLGADSLLNLTSGNDNVAIGQQVLQALTTGSQNTAIGETAGLTLDTGSGNTLIGWTSGFNYTGAESDNILINNQGVLGESNVTRIGSVQTSAYMAGIYGASVAATNAFVIIDNTGKLGTTSSGGGTVTGTATTIGAVTADVITFAMPAVPATTSFDVIISAFEATTPAGAGYFLLGSVRTTGAAASLVGTIDQVVNEEAALTTGDATIVVSANNAIVRVTGVVGLTINWSATLQFNSVS